MINLKRIIRTSAIKNGLSINNRFFISVIWLVGIGVLIGAVAAGTFYNSENSIIDAVCTDYFEKRATQSIFSCFVATFFSALVILFLSYLLGLCAVGAPILYCTLVFDSIGKGLIFGFVYLEYGILGTLKSLIFLLPQNILLCLLIVFAVKFSVKMSKQIYSMLTDSKLNEDYHISKKTYNKRYLLFVLGLFIVSVFDSLMCKFTSFIIK